MSKKVKDGKELFEDYKKEIELYSGGIIEGNMADFVKMYAFYSAVIYPTIKDYVEALSGINNK